MTTKQNYDFVYSHAADEGLYSLSKRHVFILLCAAHDFDKRWNWPGVSDSQWDIISADVGELLFRLMHEVMLVTPKIVADLKPATTLEILYNTPTLLVYDVGSYDSAYITHSMGRYTVQQDGLYLFTLQGLVQHNGNQNDSSSHQFNVTVNNNTYASQNGIYVPLQQQKVFMSVPIPLTAGDYVEVRVTTQANPSGTFYHFSNWIKFAFLG